MGWYKCKTCGAKTKTMIEMVEHIGREHPLVSEPINGFTAA